MKFGNFLILNQMVFGIRDFREINQINIKKTLQTFRYCMQQYNAFDMDEQYNAFDMDEQYLQDICMQQHKSPAAMVLQRRKRSYMAGLVPKRYCHEVSSHGKLFF